jgi:glycosyltransferase involved in cell wall biosynthesis
MTEGNSKPVVTQIVSGDLWAGAEVQVYNLCRALKASDQITPTAIVFNDGILFQELQKLGISTSLADEKTSGPLAIARSIAAHCKAHGTKIVHTHGFKENVLGILGKELARVPFSVRTVHGNPETKLSLTQPHKWLISKLDIALGRLRQQAVIAVSTQLEETLQKLFPGKVHKIFNFVDVDDIRKQWPLENRPDDSVPRVGIVGRLVPVKRVDLFLRTIALLKQQGCECVGVIIGCGPLEAQLKDLTTELGIGDRIEFKGFVNPALKELRQLDVLLMTSDHEGLPMALLESMSLGIDIVAHNVGGIPEVLDYGNAGVLIKDHTPSGYAQGVTTFLKSPGFYADKSTRRPPTVLFKQFNIDKNSQLYVSIYTGIISN